MSANMRTENSMSVVIPQTLKLLLPPEGLRFERGGVLPEAEVASVTRCAKGKLAELLSSLGLTTRKGLL